MKTLTIRSLVALGIVVTLGAAATGTAFAGSARDKAPSHRIDHRWPTAHPRSRRGIQLIFRTSVDKARSTYLRVLAQATTSAERSAAQQEFEAAIIQAVATRSASLTLLEAESGKPPEGASESNQLSNALREITSQSN